MSKPAILYQDLKPSNVVLTKEGRLKLIDPDGAGFQNDDFCIMGTRGFMAPEQEQQRSLDARTDIYALGRTLQWILEKKQRKRKKSYSPLGRILEKCTRQDPDERFQNVAEVKKAFQRLSAHYKKDEPVFSSDDHYRIRTWKHRNFHSG